MYISNPGDDLQNKILINCDFEWLLSDFIPGNHKLTATAKVIVKICEHEVRV